MNELIFTLLIFVYGTTATFGRDGQLLELIFTLMLAKKDAFLPGHVESADKAPMMRTLLWGRVIIKQPVAIQDKLSKDAVTYKSSQAVALPTPRFILISPQSQDVSTTAHSSQPIATSKCKRQRKLTKVAPSPAPPPQPSCPQARKNRPSCRLRLGPREHGSGNATSAWSYTGWGAQDGVCTARTHTA
ncbi:hypothetical protein NUW58_g4353 [Xylaria curta]|uniref:Uncharacterized protein n=1 Tax=Xylaria curta TaxID=42375 RepID=A0ACC1P8E6_9PEZI|nr:hypothetical protein NUW58_g4353 [Xylaria curta]